VAHSLEDLCGAHAASRLKTVVIWRNPKDLKPHPMNATIYQDRPDPVFDARVQAAIRGGTLEPLIITPADFILSGNRRHGAALRGELPLVPTITISVPSETMALVLFNQQREKTTGERMMEARILESALGMAAAARRARRRIDSVVNPSNAGPGRDARGVRAASPPTLVEQNLADLPRGDRETASQVAKLIGMGRESYKKAKHVLESAAAPEEIKRKLGDDEITVNRAYGEVRKREKEGESDPRPARPGTRGKQAHRPRIIRGDALAELRKLEAGTVQLIVADPPSRGSRAETPSTIHAHGPRNRLSPPLHDALLKGLFAEAARVLTPDGGLYIFTRPRLIGMLSLWVCQAGLKYRSDLVWTWSGRAAPEVANWTNAWMPILYVTRSDTPIWKGTKGKVLTNALAASGQFPESGIPLHPQDKPVGLLTRLIEVSSNPGGLVVDPFAGSGSTGEAAWKLGRESLLIEEHEPYAQVARKRVDGLAP
jgi:DNA modification methylase